MYSTPDEEGNRLDQLKKYPFNGPLLPKVLELFEPDLHESVKSKLLYELLTSHLDAPKLLKLLASHPDTSKLCSELLASHRDTLENKQPGLYGSLDDFFMADELPTHELVSTPAEIPLRNNGPSEPNKVLPWVSSHQHQDPSLSQALSQLRQQHKIRPGRAGTLQCARCRRLKKGSRDPVIFTLLRR
jgi:hypothetical protein